MMKKMRFLTVLSCIAALGLAAGCPGKDKSTCGDGVVEGSEDCDLTDLNGATCADVVTGSTGNLVCTSTCDYDITNCSTGPVCGNAIPEFGEVCDCGDDLATLPIGCTGINGATNSNCDATCQRVDLCGDGIATGAEACDCGDPSLITAATCNEGYNGTANAVCTADTCEAIIVCEFDLYDDCDTMVGPAPTHGCCEDDYGVQMDCKPSLFDQNGYMCARTCTTADQCPWNNMCFGSINATFDLCFYSQCGPGDAVEAEIFGACQAAGANPGVCIPFGRYSDSHDAYGFCMEPGNIAHWDPCPTSNADPPVWLLGTDRDADGGAADKMCDTGICLATQGAVEGVCAAFCNWEEEYDRVFYGAAVGTLSCPGTSNCWAEATISEDDQNANVQYQDYGWRSGDLGYCRETEANDATYGMTTCSLVTGQLLSNTALTCADSHTDGKCHYLTYSAEYNGPNGPVAGSEKTLGSLIGACIDYSAPTVANVWDACTPPADPNVDPDPCPEGSTCQLDDLFGAGAGTTRCIAYCDTDHHDGTIASCTDLGTPATTTDGTPVCTSVSYSYAHATLPGGAADTDKSRLGYCALPLPLP